LEAVGKSEDKERYSVDRLTEAVPVFQRAAELDPQNGAAVSATNMSFDATIAPGGNVSYGYQGTWTANDTAPSSFSLNGTACA